MIGAAIRARARTLPVEHMGRLVPADREGAMIFRWGVEINRRATFAKHALVKAV